MPVHKPYSMFQTLQIIWISERGAGRACSCVVCAVICSLHGPHEDLCSARGLGHASPSKLETCSRKCIFARWVNLHVMNFFFHRKLSFSELFGQKAQERPHKRFLTSFTFFFSLRSHHPTPIFTLCFSVNLMGFIVLFIHEYIEPTFCPSQGYTWCSMALHCKCI